MVQKSLLLVDADPRSLRVLDVSLRTAGYELASCGDVEAALTRIAASPPDLLLLDTRLPGTSGFELVEAVRKNPASERMPIIILSSDTSVESKVRGLKLGVDDYLTKPIYLKEILARIQLALSRVERDSLARRGPSGKTRLTGSLADMGIVDLLQTIDLGRKSGALELRAGERRGEVSFRDGQVLDARLGSLRGERALYRMLLWQDGEFAIDFRGVTDAQRVAIPTQGLLMEGMRRLDEWSRLTARLPPLDAPLEVDVTALRARLAEVADEANPLLARIDGRRSALAVLDATEADDLVTLDLLATLSEGGILRPVGAVPDRASPDGGALRGPGPRTPGASAVASAAPAEVAWSAAKPGQEPPRTSAQTVSPSGGTEPASPAPAAAAGREPVTKVGPASFPPPASTPKSTLIGLGFDPATLLTAAGASRAGGPRPPGTASDDEDPMSKKKRKNRSGSEQRDSLASAPASAELARKQEPARPDEAPTRADASGEGNVIQFPAKRSLPPAANDDEGDGDEGAESMPPRASSAPERRSSPDLGASAQGRTSPTDDEGLPAAIPEGSRRDDKRRKKGGAGAGSGPALADDASSEDFFRGRSPTPVEDDFSDLTTGLPSMGKESKQWMYRTFGIFAVFAVAIGAYWYYHNVHLPQPVEIGTARRSMPSLPPPSATATAAVAPAEAPAEAPEASPPEAAVEAAPVEAPVEGAELAAAAPVEAAPVEAAPVEAAPVEAAPVEAAPVEAPAAAAPAEAAAGESYASVLAEAEAARRRPSTAIPLYERAVELDPNGIEALSQLSYLLINRGRWDDIRRAAGFAERATGLDPTDSLAWLVLGVARETLGDRAGARAAYRACVDQGEAGRWQNECRPHAR